MKRRLALVAALAAAGLVLAGCVPQEPAPGPTTTSPGPTAPGPEPTPTPTSPPPSPGPEPEPEAPAAFDPDALVDAVIAKDAAAVVAMLGDPVRQVGADGETTRSASEAEADLVAILQIGENFKPAGPDTIAMLGSSGHPEFAADGAVAFDGDLGTVLAFAPGGYLRLS